MDFQQLSRSSDAYRYEDGRLPLPTHEATQICREMSETSNKVCNHGFSLSFFIENMSNLTRCNKRIVLLSSKRVS